MQHPPHEPFDRFRHIVYFSSHLRQVPSFYDKLDTNRLTLVHFAVHALDMLNVWENDEILQKLQLHKQGIIEWIYNLQVITTTTHNNEEEEEEEKEEEKKGVSGFLGGTFLGEPFQHQNGSTNKDSNSNSSSSNSNSEYRIGHIAMTYTALATLYILGDDFSRVDKSGIIESLRYLQRSSDGSFQSVRCGSEQDARFLYCACAISYILNDYSGINIAQACQYIVSCKSYDGAVGLIPGQEGHGGSTFVAIASLLLLKQYHTVVDAAWKKDLIRWCVHRQVEGMQGRPNKDEDTCYSFWIGGTLRLLDYSETLLEQNKLYDYVLSCQYNRSVGGFSKTRHAYPDILHSFYSLSYLSFSSADETYRLQQEFVCQQKEQQQKHHHNIRNNNDINNNNNNDDDNDDNNSHDSFEIIEPPLLISKINCTLGFSQKKAEQLSIQHGHGKLEFP